MGTCCCNVPRRVGRHACAGNRDLGVSVRPSNAGPRRRAAGAQALPPGVLWARRMVAARISRESESSIADPRPKGLRGPVVEATLVAARGAFEDEYAIAARASAVTRLRRRMRSWKRPFLVPLLVFYGYRRLRVVRDRHLERSSRTCPTLLGCGRKALATPPSIVRRVVCAASRPAMPAAKPKRSSARRGLTGARSPRDAESAGGSPANSAARILPVHHGSTAGIDRAWGVL